MVKSVTRCARSVIYTARGCLSRRNDQLVSGVSSAIAEACNLPREDVPLPSGKTVSTWWVLLLFSEYPLDQASLDDLMALENPMVLETTGHPVKEGGDVRHAWSQ